MDKMTDNQILIEAIKITQIAQQGDTFFTSDEMRIIIKSTGLQIQAIDKMEDDYIRILEDIEQNLLTIVGGKKTKKLILQELTDSVQLICLMNTTLKMSIQAKREYNNTDINEPRDKYPEDHEHYEDEDENDSFDDENWENWK